MAEISPLRRRMIDDMMIRNLSPATQQSYLYAVAKFDRGDPVLARAAFVRPFPTFSPCRSPSVSGSSTQWCSLICRPMFC
jgi:hypothetical protein